MLDRYFLRPETVDRIRSSWIGEAIDRYVGWLAEHGYAARNVFRRVPILRHFGEFARAHGATTVTELPAHIEAFKISHVDGVHYVDCLDVILPLVEAGRGDE